VTEIRFDGSYIRLALLAVVPIYAGFACSSAITIVNAVFQLFAPVGDNLGNSRYHSATAPNPAKFPGVELPHITIQIPVFKEGLRRLVQHPKPLLRRLTSYAELLFQLSRVSKLL
jgi:hypothetical protein